MKAFVGIVTFLLIVVIGTVSIICWKFPHILQKIPGVVPPPVECELPHCPNPEDHDHECPECPLEHVTYVSPKCNHCDEEINLSTDEYYYILGIDGKVIGIQHKVCPED